MKDKYSDLYEKMIFEKSEKEIVQKVKKLAKGVGPVEKAQKNLAKKVNKIALEMFRELVFFRQNEFEAGISSDIDVDEFIDKLEDVKDGLYDLGKSIEIIKEVASEL